MSYNKCFNFVQTIGNFTQLKFLMSALVYFHLALVLTFLVKPNEAQLHSIQVSESPCRHIQPMSPDMNMIMSMAKSVMYPYYVPMASQHFYRSNFEALMGRPARNEDELSKMNLRIRGSPSHTWITTGEDQRFFQQCVPMFALFKAWCITGLGSQSTNLSPTRRIVTTLVWSDKKSSALFTRCVLGHHNDWYVLSTEPKLDNDAMKQVLHQVMILGFNVTHAAKMKYNDFLF